jgi:nitroreductase
MSFLTLAESRRSVRRYHDREVEEEKLRTILEAGRLAPSACNFQPWHFVVIRDRKLKARLREAYDKDWFIDAPVIIVAACDRRTSWKRKDGKDYGDIDIAIAVDHITLAAAELNLGTCWVGAFDQWKAREALSLPYHIEPIILLPLGYPADEPREKSREGLDSMLHQEGF